MGSSQSQTSGAPKSAATHTPGPWNAELGGELLPADVRLIIADLGQEPSGIRRIRTVAKTFNNAGSDESLANAHLIASAPDLLEEAREICAILDLYRANTGEEPCFDHEAIGEEVARRHDSLTAAIAKAAGQEVTASGDELAREGSVSGMNPEKGAPQ